MAEMRLVVAGAGGRMGRTLVKAIADSKGFALAGALEDARSPLIGWDAGTLAGLGENGIKLTGDAGPAAGQGRRHHRFHRAGGDGGLCRARGQGRQGAHHRHHRLERRRRGQDQGRRQDRGDRQVRQYEPRRQSAGGAGQARRQDARQFLRHRNPGNASQPESRCAVRHRAAARPRGGGRPRHRSRQAFREEPRRPHRRPQGRATSALRRCAAAAWSASTA